MRLSELILWLRFAIEFALEKSPFVRFLSNLGELYFFFKVLDWMIAPGWNWSAPWYRWILSLLVAAVAPSLAWVVLRLALQLLYIIVSVLESLHGIG